MAEDGGLEYLVGLSTFFGDSNTMLFHLPKTWLGEGLAPPLFAQFVKSLRKLLSTFSYFVLGHLQFGLVCSCAQSLIPTTFTILVSGLNLFLRLLGALERRKT